MCEYCSIQEEFLRRLNANAGKKASRGCRYDHPLSSILIKNTQTLSILEFACSMEDFATTDERSCVFN